MIYVLYLEQEKYYVGYSARPLGMRILEHFHHFGAKWTKLYKPVEVLQIFPDGTLNDEDEITLQMMELYGWWNVRGGRWCQVEMNQIPRALLRRKGIVHNLQHNMLREPDPLAYPRLTFFRGTQTQRPAFDSQEFMDVDIPDELLLEVLDAYENQSISSQGTIEELACFRCGRVDHLEANCSFQTFCDGTPLQQCTTIGKQKVLEKGQPVSHSVTIKEEDGCLLEQNTTPLNTKLLAKSDSAICVDMGIPLHHPVTPKEEDGHIDSSPTIDEDIRIHICMRCGRADHYLDECNHFTYFDGTMIPNSTRQDNLFESDDDSVMGDWIGDYDFCYNLDLY